MINTKLVSIIVPVYNREKYLVRCIDSLIEQSYNNIEIIIIDDCSTDRSVQIINEYQKKYKMIKLISFDHNRGPMTARWIGCQTATGDYIFFCDSDDYLPKNAIELLINAIVDGTEDIILGAYSYINIKGVVRKHLRNLPYGLKQNDIQKALLAMESICSLWGILFRANLLKNCDYCIMDNLTHSEDRMFLIQIIYNASHVKLISESVYYYCQNQQSSSRKKLTDKELKSNIYVYSWCYNYLKKHNVDSYFLNRFQLRIISYMIEFGYNKEIILQDFSDLNLFTFHKMKKYLGILYTLHTYMCFYFSLYQVLSKKGRIFIQKLQCKS